MSFSGKICNWFKNVKHLLCMETRIFLVEVVVVFAILEQLIQANIKSAYALRRKRSAQLAPTIKHE